MVFFLVDIEPLLGLESEFKYNALSVTAIDFSGSKKHNSIHKSQTLATKPQQRDLNTVQSHYTPTS